MHLRSLSSRPRPKLFTSTSRCVPIIDTFFSSLQLSAKKRTKLILSKDKHTEQPPIDVLLTHKKHDPLCVSQEEQRQIFKPAYTACLVEVLNHVMDGSAFCAQPTEPSRELSPPSPAPVHQPSPPSVVSFSFSQFLSQCDDVCAPDVSACVKDSSVASRSESLPKSVTSTAVAESDEPPSFAPTLSFEDCVLFKLCLTCALCGRLLRRQPAAIETCGHCFCYDCINTAVEEGCVPLGKQWPWSRLSWEVDAAGARWAEATRRSEASKTAPDLRTFGAPTSPVRHQRTGASHKARGNGEKEEEDIVVTAVTFNRAQSASPSTGAATSGLPPRPQNPRKVRQMCPLCLGPAFKWMLVSVPPVAELCRQLSAVYPALEDMLHQLTEESSGSAARPIPLNSAPVVCPANQTDAEEPNEQPQQHQTPVSKTDTFVTAAFARSSTPLNIHRRNSSNSESDEEDEEAERRRQRSSGGLRKGITFADEVRAPAKVARRPTPDPAPASVAENREEEPTPQLSPCEVPLPTEDDAPPDTSTMQQGSSFATLSSIAAAALQHSVDLIPSPSTSVVVAGSTTSKRLSACGTQAAPNGNDTKGQTAHKGSQLQLGDTPLIPSGVLGQSPPSEHQGDGEPQDTSKRWAAAPTPPPRTAEHSAASQVPYLSEAQEDIQEGVDDVLGQSSAALVVNACGVKGSVQPLVGDARQYGCVLLDTAPELAEPTFRKESSMERRENDAASCFARLSAAGYAVVCDKADADTAESQVGSQRTPSYCSVRVSPRRDYASTMFASLLKHQRAEVCSASEQGDATCDGDSATIASVHPSDVWDLDTAHLQRHPYISNCYVALRAGHLKWKTGESGLGETPPSETSTLTCVAGQYQRASVQLHTGAIARDTLPLSPAVCTAAVLGVPCFDVEWVCAQRSPLPPSAAAGVGTRDNGADANTSSTPPPDSLHSLLPEHLRKERENVPLLRSHPTPLLLCSPSRRPGSWMSRTCRLLQSTCRFRHSRTASADVAVEVAPTEVSTTGSGAQCFFVLPDRAVLQLVALLYGQEDPLPYQGCRDGTAALSVVASQPVPEQQQKQLEHDHPPTSRKRRRGGDHDDDQEEAWDATEGHPQAAWRRLLLASGAAAVEVSACLFTAIVAASCAADAAEMDNDGRTGEDNSSRADESALLARCLRLSPRNAAMHNWIHVDVGECSLGTDPNWESKSVVDASVATVADAPAAQHTLFLLYSPAVARRAYTQLSATDNQLAFPPLLSGAPNLALSGEKVFLVAFQKLLNRVAALIASVVSPVLPTSARGGPFVAHDVRPAQWLLRNIADNRRSPGFCSVPAGIKPRRKETQAREGFTDNVRQNAPSPVAQPRHSTLQEVSGVAVGARQPDASSDTAAPTLTSSVPPHGAWPDVSQDPPHRVGVYRNLLYSDTP